MSLPAFRRCSAAESSTSSRGSPMCEPPPICWRSLECTFIDRKSTRLNSSHSQISYAVFCLKKHEALPPRLSHGGPEDRTMAQMDAVERAERDGARERVRRVGFESPDDPHAGFGRVSRGSSPP